MTKELTNVNWLAVQRRLKKLGFDPGPLDGERGPLTNAAIVAYKRSIGFRARPLYGRMTHAALFSEVQEPDQKPEPLPWLRLVNAARGKHEIHHNKWLRNWLKSDGHALGDPARFPWCGDLVETAIRLSLPDEPFPGPLGENPYWARNWKYLGDRLPRPMRGCVANWERGSGGHVGFIVGEDSTHWYVDGGNQGDTVSRVRMSKTRRKLLSANWPVTWGQDPDPLPRMTPGNLIVSTNEA